MQLMGLWGYKLWGYDPLHSDKAYILYRQIEGPNQ
jgi:hypothetical protein